MRMGNNALRTVAQEMAAAAGADRISVRRWFLLYAMLLTAGVASLLLALQSQALSVPRGWSDFVAVLAQTSPPTKLLILGIYLSLCCSFLPLNTSWIVGAVATRHLAVGAGLWDTAALVASVGALGSTIGNLHDYHLFTWLLRRRRVAKLRETRLFQAAARWFHRSPFWALVVFNVLPVPVDVVRVVATTCRYSRLPFAAANFLGRFVRYATIAVIIYALAVSIETAVLALLIVAAALIVGRATLPAGLRAVARVAAAARGGTVSRKERNT